MNGVESRGVRTTRPIHSAATSQRDNVRLLEGVGAKSALMSRASGSTGCRVWSALPSSIASTCRIMGSCGEGVWRGSPSGSTVRAMVVSRVWQEHVPNFPHKCAQSAHSWTRHVHLRGRGRRRR